MTAAEFVKPDTDKEPNTETARRVLHIALDKGLLLYPCGHWNQIIRLIPALNVTQAQIDEGFNIFAEAVLEVQKGQ
jgi:4-aminobutyrate aminotransferase-like enzyme